MTKIGVVEGFFGPSWPETDRKNYASFLSSVGGDFYIYAPKRDHHLRKGWRDAWDESYLQMLRELVETFHSHHISFGVGFSPIGLGSELSAIDKKLLQEKLKILNELGIDMLGLFFDDMPVSPNLASIQVAALRVVQESFKGKIIFCPSYYTPDPILDKVFGARPDHYLEDIAAGVSLDVAIAWTGPKVISPTIDRAHLLQVTELLKRKPYIWENIFANDGPRNCKFLKLKPFTGREESVFEETEAFAFNLMNQPKLSQILFLASSLVLKDKKESSEAFTLALDKLCSEPFKEFVIKHQAAFNEQGFDLLSSDLKEQWISELKEFSDAAAKEIIDWLQGHYLVGPECLTD